MDIKKIVREVLSEQMLLEGASDIMYHFTKPEHAVSILTETNIIKIKSNEKQNNTKRNQKVGATGT
jgi:hypothetical protein